METATFQAIPVENIKPSSHQARKDFNPDAIQTLADSMKLEGLIQPIVVRPVNGSFELVAGERRFRAAKLLQWPTIDAKVVATVSEGEAAAKGLVENLQRQDLNPIEEAEGFQQLNQLDPNYWTQDEIAKVAGRSRVYITQSLGFLKLPPEVQDYVRRLTLSRSHALELLSLTPENQQKAADQVVKEGLSIKQTRQLVAKMQGNGTKSAASHKPQAVSSKLTADSSQLADPLAERWPGVRSATASSGIWWDVKYGPHKLPTGDPLNGWFFFASPVAGEAAPEALAGWFQEMAESLKQPGSVSESGIGNTGSSPIPDPSPIPIPNTGLAPRLPQNPEEEAELQRIAADDGPKAVYAWIYGEGSMMVKMVPFATWQEAGMTAADGLKQILDGIRQFEQSRLPT